MVGTLQGVQYADLPYFVGLATLTIYIGAHRGLSSRNRQQLSMQQVQRALPLALVITGTALRAQPLN